MSPDWNPKSPSLLPTIVCYADVLGFRGMTERAHESGEEKEFLQQIKNSLSSAYEIVRGAKTFEGAVTSTFDMKVFTDNIVVAYPLRAPSQDLGEPELCALLMLFAEVQASLASDGLLLRGAVAAGDHYQDDDIAYGKAFLEAVDLDKSGSAPRLVIAPSLESLIEVHLSWYGDGGLAPHFEQLLEDPHDESLFLNYLDVAFQYFPDGPINHELLARHRDSVLRGLKENASIPHVREKYEWTASYHNYVCRTFAERYSTEVHEEVDWEQMVYVDAAKRALEYILPCEDLASAQSPRRLDAKRLRQRLSNRMTPDAAEVGD